MMATPILKLIGVEGERVPVVTRPEHFPVAGELTAEMVTTAKGNMWTFIVPDCPAWVLLTITRMFFEASRENYGWARNRDGNWEFPHPGDVYGPRAEPRTVFETLAYWLKRLSIDPPAVYCEELYVLSRDTTPPHRWGHAQRVAVKEEFSYDLFTDEGETVEELKKNYPVAFKITYLYGYELRVVRIV